MDEGSGCEPGACKRPGKHGGMCPECARVQRNARKRINRAPLTAARLDAEAAERRQTDASAPPCTDSECFRRGPLGGVCRACSHRAAMARRQIRRHSDEALQAAEREGRKRHYAKHRDYYLTKGKEWREAHPEYASEKWRAWYAEHREEFLARLAQPEQRARQRAWQNADRAAHPEKYREKARRERAGNERFTLRNRENSRRRQSGTTYSRILYSTVLERDGMVCHLCGDPIASLDDLHFDHVIPLAKGGEHTVENVRPSHSLCNMRKGARLI